MSKHDKNLAPFGLFLDFAPHEGVFDGLVCDILHHDFDMHFDQYMRQAEQDHYAYAYRVFQRAFRKARKTGAVVLEVMP